MVIGASGFYVWPFNCDAHSSSQRTLRNIAIFVESISRIRLISRIIIINQVIELLPSSYSCAVCIIKPFIREMYSLYIGV